MAADASLYSKCAIITGVLLLYNNNNNNQLKFYSAKFDIPVIPQASAAGQPNTSTGGQMPAFKQDSTAMVRRPLDQVTCFKCGEKGHYANMVGLELYRQCMLTYSECCVVEVCTARIIVFFRYSTAVSQVIQSTTDGTDRNSGTNRCKCRRQISTIFNIIPITLYQKIDITYTH